MRTRAWIAGMLVLAVGGGGLAVVSPAGAAKKRTPRKTVKVGDYFFSPKALSVKKGTVVTWKWARANADTHDVKLTKAPKGVKRFHSESASTGYSFKRTLKKPGTYKLICTFHQNMKQTIKVKR